MDLTSPLKPDVFRVVMVILLPGLLATFPWLAWFYWPELLDASFWKESGLVAGLFLLAIALIAGMILEDIGADLEVRVIDPYVRKMKGIDEEAFEGQWKDYLMTSGTDRYVAHRYLRAMVTRFKFELSMIPALCSVALALILATFAGKGFELQRMIGFLIADVAMLYFLFDQAWRGAWQLHELRLGICAEEKSTTGSAHIPKS